MITGLHVSRTHCHSVLAKHFLQLSALHISMRVLIFLISVNLLPAFQNLFFPSYIVSQLPFSLPPLLSVSPSSPPLSLPARRTPPPFFFFFFHKRASLLSFTWHDFTIRIGRSSHSIQHVVICVQLWPLGLKFHLVQLKIRLSYQ